MNEEIAKCKNHMRNNTYKSGRCHKKENASNGKKKI